MYTRKTCMDLLGCCCACLTKTKGRIKGPRRGEQREDSARMADQADASKYIHGVLDATVYEATHLHGGLHGNVLQVTEKVEEALHIHQLPHSKLYATIDIGSARVARTRVVEFRPQNLKWNESFHIYCAHSSPWITVSVKDQHHVGAEVLGRAKIPTSRLLSGEPVEGWFDLLDDDDHEKGKAQVHVLLKFSDVVSDPCWNVGIKREHFRGVSNAYFPLRTGCLVKLYQNSHLSNSFQPAILLSNGENYRPARLWEELYVAITEAKHFIYVAGWSVNVNITLVRDVERMIPGAQGVTFGELLKRKAEEGVTVLVMPWQDPTSLKALNNAGLMGTHDEETNKFFQGSKVKCFLCPRQADPTLTAVQKAEVEIQFTHHQKTVTLDAPSGDVGARQIVSFVGGIDLCDGRYDDEDHVLFRRLNTTYLEDFHQNNFRGGADLQHGGPREPWHDIHSKLEGPAARDVLTNFRQRWEKQSPKGFNKFLLDNAKLDDLFPDPSESQTDRSWNVQVLRSIDDASVVNFPTDPSEAARRGLTSGKDVTIDQSIHSGYVEAIRRAKRFIYIENQYFFGSCASWREDQDSGCLNLIPIEIALKIASKIRQGERFAAYVVTPMWPEGIPEDETVQAILHWNRLTMEMMYSIVAKAIENAGLNGQAHPCDYLNFFCLGNREVKRQGEYVPPEHPKPDTNYWRAQVNRRFLIYVHAKLMIVDDEYVIVGSANLNQRSLAGDRDTEIAQGSYQPAQLNESGRARGDIHGFRMSLWYEHFMSRSSYPSEVFLEPETLNCVRTVKQIAESLWDKFAGDKVVDLPGHLLPFPISVSANGKLSEITEDGFFPDTKAPIKGKISELLPPILTT